MFEDAPSGLPFVFAPSTFPYICVRSLLPLKYMYMYHLSCKFQGWPSRSEAVLTGVRISKVFKKKIVSARANHELHYCIEAPLMNGGVGCVKSTRFALEKQQATKHAIGILSSRGMGQSVSSKFLEMLA